MNTIKKELALKILAVIFLIFAIQVNYYVLYIDETQKICYNDNMIKEKIILNDIVSRAESEARSKYSQEDLILLATLIECEAGSNWITDEHQQLVAMVALNRVKSDKFPDTLKEVIYQHGQYSCVGNSRWIKGPTERSLRNAKLTIEGNVYCPTNVLFQAEFKQGIGVYKSFYSESSGSTTYFCYGND